MYLEDHVERWLPLDPARHELLYLARAERRYRFHRLFQNDSIQRGEISSMRGRVDRDYWLEPQL